jgi:hypothetical protein
MSNQRNRGSAPTIGSLCLDDFVGNECNCEFSPYDDEPEEESWHFRRRCKHCGHVWYGLHCPHDRIQNPCPSCGTRPAPTGER